MSDKELKVQDAFVNSLINHYETVINQYKTEIEQLKSMSSINPKKNSGVDSKFRNNMVF